MKPLAIEWWKYNKRVGKKESVGDRNLIFIEWQIELNGIDCWQQ